MIDLNHKHLRIIKDILARHVAGCEVRAFGSRVTGQAKRYSDPDLSIVSDEALSPRTLALLEDDFAESDLPFKVDVLDWSAVSDPFRQIIMQDYAVLQPAHPGGAIAGPQASRE